MNSSLNTAYIGMGSNLENPVKQLQSAARHLRQHHDIADCQFSHLYNTTPVGPQDQPDYANAAAKVTTALSPIELLDLLQSIENQHGRERNIRWGARTLDLDLLLFNEETIDHPRLIVPHNQIKFRNFVMVPVLDLTPDLHFPDGQSFKEALNLAPDNAIALITDQSL